MQRPGHHPEFQQRTSELHLSNIREESHPKENEEDLNTLINI
jgi:hypothetical protein